MPAGMLGHAPVRNLTGFQAPWLEADDVAAGTDPAGQVQEVQRGPAATGEAEHRAVCRFGGAVELDAGRAGGTEPFPANELGECLDGRRLGESRRGELDAQ